MFKLLRLLYLGIFLFLSKSLKNGLNTWTHIYGKWMQNERKGLKIHNTFCTAIAIEM